MHGLRDCIVRSATIPSSNSRRPSRTIVIAARSAPTPRTSASARAPVGGGTGWGNLQSIVTEAHPEMGLTAAASFL